MLPRWGCFEDPTFRENARALVPDAAFLDELLDAVKYVLQRDPRSGRHIANGIWWFAAEDWPGGVDVTIMYSFDDVNVTLHEISERTPD